MKVDVDRQEVRFAVRDKESFDVKEVRRVVEAEGFKVGPVKAGP